VHNDQQIGRAQAAHGALEQMTIVTTLALMAGRGCALRVGSATSADFRIHDRRDPRCYGQHGRSYQDDRSSYAESNFSRI
jgi:hypothetical protein